MQWYLKPLDVSRFYLTWNLFDAEAAGLFKELPALLPRFWKLLNSSAFAKPVSQARQRGTVVLEDLGTTIIIRSNELRESEKKRMPQKKALVDLLKELRNLGFSHHRSAIPKVMELIFMICQLLKQSCFFVWIRNACSQSVLGWIQEERTSKSWILQPACRVDYFFSFFLNVSAGCTLGTSDLATGQVHNVSCIWSKACDYYFKNLALIQQLREHSLNFHKDLMLQEVWKSLLFHSWDLHGKILSHHVLSFTGGGCNCVHGACTLRTAKAALFCPWLCCEACQPSKYCLPIGHFWYARVLQIAKFSDLEHGHSETSFGRDETLTPWNSWNVPVGVKRFMKYPKHTFLSVVMSLLFIDKKGSSLDQTRKEVLLLSFILFSARNLMKC